MLVLLLLLLLLPRGVRGRRRKDGEEWYRSKVVRDVKEIEKYRIGKESKRRRLKEEG